MALFDIFKSKKANTLPSSAQAPFPLSQSGFNRLNAYGNGSLVSLLTRQLPGSHRDWSTEAGDLGLNSIVAISIDWYNRNFSQAVPKVYRPSSTQQDDSVEHPIINLIKNPSNLYVSSIFWSFVIQDYKLLGNAYVRKIRVGGKVVSLQYLPADMVQPVGNTITPIEYWTYTVDGVSYKIENKDIIHFRYGRDPKDLRLGRSPVASVLREIATDNYASSTAFGLMRNGPIPAMILGPDANDLAVDISPDDAKTVKRKLQEDFTADNAGNVAVMTGPYKMDRVSWSPEELTLDTIRRLPEERITAALGINAMVLGLGAGLERSTYQNYERSQQQAWEDGMIPLLKQLAEVITFTLMYEYPETQDGEYFEFDVSNVRALADDLDSAAKRAEILYTAGIATLEEAKLIAGLTNTSTPTVSDENTVRTQQSETLSKSFAREVAQEILNTPIVEPSFYSYFEETKATPTQGMKDAARRALKWKEEGFDGGTRVGLARANQIVNGENLSDDTILRMYSFFSRHEVDKKASGFYEGQEGYPSNGRVAWDLWGGDPGFSWSKKNRDRIIKEEDDK